MKLQITKNKLQLVVRIMQLLASERRTELGRSEG
jgi:hypothetical protein